MIALRDYQEEAIAAILAAEARGVRRQLLQMATGLGKTIVFGSLIARTPGRCLVLAHRDELISQAVEKLQLVDHTLAIGRVKAERNEVGYRVTVASVQTLAREHRRAKLGQFDRVVIDEAHHAAAPTYQAILEATGCYEPTGPLLLGVTATPVRGDGIGLAEIFEELTFERDIRWGIESGYLCDLRGVRLKLDLDLDQVRTRGGDFADGDLGAALEAAHAPGMIAQAYIDHSPGRRAIVFTPTVETARQTVAALQDAGEPAELVHGAMDIDERRAVLSRFQQGETRVVANCAVLTEGFDEPAVDAIIVARPTKSAALYQQMVGRGTRRHPGKSDCLILDLVGVSSRHKLQSVNDLVGLPLSAYQPGASLSNCIAQQKEELARTEAAGRLVAETVNLFQRRDLHWLQTPRGWVLPIGGQTLVLEPVAGDQWQLASVSRDRHEVLGDPEPLTYAMGRAEDLARQGGGLPLVAKDAPWRALPASAKQLETLDKMRVRFAPRLTRGEASDLITRAIAGRRRIA